jgi:carboxyl-terminal processing protease
MPRRNLFILIVMMLVAMLCHRQASTTPYHRVLSNALTRIENNYLEPIPASKLFEGAMEGMVGKLDEHSVYIPDSELDAFQEEIDQEFAGVGMEVAVDPQTKQLIVLSPLVGSPAYKAGILAGDQILQIGETATLGMSMKEALALLRGKPGDAVSITVLHEGAEKPEKIKLVREIIQIDSVLGDTRNADGSWNFFLEGHDRIGYIRISSFTDKTIDELLEALEWLSAHEMRGLVLDLRDNPGGYLEAAIDVCDQLISSGVIVSTRRRGGHVDRVFNASGHGSYTDFPMTVLVNQQTASAGEIVAACLQDHHRATIIGQRTYGKGTIQEVVDLESGCGAMKFTTGSYWRPNGKNIHRLHNADEKSEWGVSPDNGYKIVLTNDEQNLWRMWRGRRDVFQSVAVQNAATEAIAAQNEAAKNDAAKDENDPAENDLAKNTAKKTTEKSPAKKVATGPFVDRPLQLAIERIEKITAGK